MLAVKGRRQLTGWKVEWTFTRTDGVSSYNTGYMYSQYIYNLSKWVQEPEPILTLQLCSLYGHNDKNLRSLQHEKMEQKKKITILLLFLVLYVFTGAAAGKAVEKLLCHGTDMLYLILEPINEITICFQHIFFIICAFQNLGSQKNPLDFLGCQFTFDLKTDCGR